MTGVQPSTQQRGADGPVFRDRTPDPGLPLGAISGMPAGGVLHPKAVPRRRSLRLAMAPSLVLGGVLCLFLGLPLVGLLQRALVNGGLADALRRPIVLEAIRLSIITTVLVLVLTLIFGSPLALVLAR